MKTKLTLALLSLAPALLAAEPSVSSSPPAPASESQLVSTNAPAFSEDLAEQAALVQQIGEEAARGFDMEAHAHALRMQMESLAAMPVTTNTPVVPRPVESGKIPSSGSALGKLVTPPAAAGSITTTAPRPAPAAVPLLARPGETTMRSSIQRMRAALDELESQVNKNTQAQ